MGASADHAPVRVLPHIKRLDECFGDFLVRVTCPCGSSRHIEPEALARIAGRSVTLAARLERDARSTQLTGDRRKPTKDKLIHFVVT
jgi:hypothetical protein